MKLFSYRWSRSIAATAFSLSAVLVMGSGLALAAPPDPQPVKPMLEHTTGDFQSSAVLEDENGQGSQPETEPGVAYGKKGESVGGALGGLFFGKGGAAIGGMIGGWLEDNLGGDDDDDGDKGDDDKGGSSDDDDISIDGGSLECRIVIQCPRPGVD